MQPHGSALAIIPARSGSKRFPGKNIALLGGKPLLLWTVEAALESECFATIWVSSDIHETSALLAGYGSRVRLVSRPADLATDTATTPQVVKELLQRPEAADLGMERICMLLPTVPFRSGEDIRASAPWLTSEWDSVVSICEYDAPPQMAFSLAENRALNSLFPNSPLGRGVTRSQDMQTAYHPNGALYWAWANRFSATGSFYQGQVRGFPMSRQTSIDIDTPEDLEWANWQLSKVTHA